MTTHIGLGLDRSSGSARPCLGRDRDSRFNTKDQNAVRQENGSQVPAGPVTQWRTPDDLLLSLEHFAQARGFNRVLLRAWFQVSPAHAQRSTVTNYPDEWLSEYRSRKLHTLDPILRHATLCGTPFGWEEVSSQTPGERRFLSRAADFGLRHGMTVPLHGAGGELFALSFAGRMPPQDLDKRWDLFAEVYRFLSESLPRMREILSHPTESPVQRPLTRAQREVFIHLMNGKSLKDIARCLNLHIRAVEDRVARACQSLQAKSRTQALARALNSAQIRLHDDDVDDQGNELWHARE